MATTIKEIPLHPKQNLFSLNEVLPKKRQQFSLSRKVSSMPGESGLVDKENVLQGIC